MENSVHILDCTLREGGYLTDWHFPESFVKNYLQKMQDLGITLIEPGFRLFHKNPDSGKFAHCTDEFLQTLSIAENFRIAIMVKAEELLEINTEKVLREMFAEAADSPVEIVRIATPYQKAPECGLIAEILKNKGYKVSLNLTKIPPGEETRLKEAVKNIDYRHIVDILYFADTFGEFSPRDVEKITRIINQKYYGQTGFHGHNNKNQALINSMTAINKGVLYIDSTFKGMGKGVGNLETEAIVQKMGRQFVIKK